jgi:hypothetical protein
LSESDIDGTGGLIVSPVEERVQHAEIAAICEFLIAGECLGLAGLTQ